MKNLGILLTSQGTSYQNISRSNLFILDMADFKDVDAAYKSYFDSTKPYPARTAVAVHQLPRGSKFEIQVDAVIEHN